MQITFYPRGNKLQVRISDGSKVNYRFSTGLKISSELPFVQGKFLGHSPEADSLNTELARMKYDLTSLYAQYKDYVEIKKRFSKWEQVLEVSEAGEYDLAPLCLEYIRLASKGQIKTKKGANFSQNTLSSYTFAVAWVVNFSNLTKGLDLSKYNLAPETDLQVKKKMSREYQEYFTALENYMISQEVSQSSRANILNILSIIIRYWEDDLYIKVPTFKMPIVKVNPIVILDDEFVRKFVNDEYGFYPHMNYRMRFLYEVCATILVTTLRVDDAVTLKWKDFTFEKGVMYMSKLNRKTGHYTNMPIPKRLADIFQENMSKYGHIYTVYRENMHQFKDTAKSKKIDYYLVPKLFAMYPEMRELITIRSFGIHGEEIAETKPFYDAVHPHMLRKTAISLMIFNGVPERIVRDCSGHKSNAFERYVAFSQSKFNNAVSEYYSKVLGNK